MSVFIFLLLVGGALVIWNWNKNQPADKVGWVSTVLLYGVRNFSSLGFCIILAALILAKLWLIMLGLVIVWFIYMAIKKDLPVEK